MKSGLIVLVGELAAGMQAVQQTPQLPVLSENGWVTAAAAIIVNGREFVSQSSTYVPGSTRPPVLITNPTVGPPLRWWEISFSRPSTPGLVEVSCLYTV